MVILSLVGGEIEQLFFLIGLVGENPTTTNVFFLIKIREIKLWQEDIKQVQLPQRLH